jgi:hypothetical protein
MNSNLQKITDLTNTFIKNNEINLGFQLYQKLQQLLSLHPDLSKRDSDLFYKYQNILIQLKFLTLNFFEVDDYIDLLKNYLPLGLEKEEINVWGKIKVLLLGLISFDDRDILKKKLLGAVAGCSRKFFSDNSYSTEGMPVKTNEWIKNFLANLGLPPFDLLKKQEYLTNNQFVKTLKGEDKDKLRRLLDLYENLSLSSNIKEGNENTVLIEAQNHLVILEQGQTEELDKELTDDFLNKQDGSDTPPNLVKGIVVNNQILDLNQSLKSYSPSSLEYKAIKQEIGRMERLAPKDKKTAPSPKSRSAKIDLDQFKK